MSVLEKQVRSNLPLKTECLNNQFSLFKRYLKSNVSNEQLLDVANKMLDELYGIIDDLETLFSIDDSSDVELPDYHKLPSFVIGD